MGEGSPNIANPVVIYIPCSWDSVVCYSHDEGCMQYVCSDLWGFDTDCDRDEIWMSYVLDLSGCACYVSVFNYEAAILQFLQDLDDSRVVGLFGYSDSVLSGWDVKEDELPHYLLNVLFTSSFFSFPPGVGLVWDLFEIIYPFDISCLRVNHVVDISYLFWSELVVFVPATAGPVSFPVLVLVPILGAVVSVSAVVCVVVVSVTCTLLVSVLILVPIAALVSVPVLGKTSLVVGLVTVVWVTRGGPHRSFLRLICIGWYISLLGRLLSLGFLLVCVSICLAILGMVIPRVLTTS
jgi:hypothetical protein